MVLAMIEPEMSWVLKSRSEHCDAMEVPLRDPAFREYTFASTWATAGSSLRRRRATLMCDADRNVFSRWRSAKLRACRLATAGK